MAFGDADAYARFMGRFSEPLAPAFADLVDVPPGGRVLDVGCGPGVLTAVLAERYGADRVDAIDPAAGFVEAARARLPGVDVREGSAEELPWRDDSYDAVLAQLVVHFMRDPARGLREMHRVAKPGAPLAASVWDHPGGRGPLTPFWAAVQDLDPGGVAEASAGSHEGELVRMFEEAGLTDVRGGELSVTVPMASFDEWWAPYREPAGSVGDYLATRTPAQVDALRDRCRERLGDGPFEVTAWAWVATGAATR
ncbi:class I SAM-dependent methyltransferase [Nocardioides sp.]|uniref:class I SAM-dependent methyltransferase n=1 Tax=Nocardioides sp. TaxID=35761 RepID=UPI001A31241A|nr:class I SAM-dependent methyltransferase [Nocardioides sp.]MBJ7356051.1 class I SAM-dependent methyltransferase [Nocardioides sp.]